MKFVILSMYLGDLVELTKNEWGCRVEDISRKNARDGEGDPDQRYRVCPIIMKLTGHAKIAEKNCLPIYFRQTYFWDKTKQARLQHLLKKKRPAPIPFFLRLMFFLDNAKEESFPFRGMCADDIKRIYVFEKREKKMFWCPEP